MFKLIKSEWRKFRSLKSLWIWSAAAILVVLGITLITVVSANSYGSDGSVGLGAGDMSVLRADLWTFPVSSLPVFFQIALAVVMILIVTGEFKGGQIKSTLLASPRRGRTFAGKFIFATILAVVLSAAALLLGFVLTFALQNFSNQSFGAALARNFAGGFLLPLAACVIWAWLAFGLGFVFRSSAGAILIMVALAFVLPVLVGMGGSLAWVKTLSDLTPQSAFGLILSGQNVVRSLLVLAIWTAVICSGGLALFARRDCE
ncbi:MAG: ABC transporter permease [Candidatus Nomurabacteria bacterium]|jgi:ABC-2 type transport system permease protein|nr:ABC transporter permease [Candidatus Nomurabacteria bacterium]